MIELELANLRIKFKKKKERRKRRKRKLKKIKVPLWKDISKIPPLDQIGHLVDFGVLKKLVPARIKDLFGYLMTTFSLLHLQNNLKPLSQEKLSH